MGNLDLWDSVADIDPKFTKPITGKQYKGTSPNPQYMIKLATEKFGPAGHGFGWEVVAEGFQPLSEDELLHWCRIRFWTKAEDGSRGGFESYGQTKARYKTKSGSIMTDEDAPKKSLTDAVTKALAQLGFAGNIFLGRWDDSKYVDAVQAEYRGREANEAFEAEVKRKVAIIKAETSLDGLRHTYGALYKTNREVAVDPRVVAAKDDRKMDLETQAEMAGSKEAAE